MVVIGICGKSTKSFILIVFDRDDNEDFHAIFFLPKFYSQTKPIGPIGDHVAKKMKV
jgi:hypothetical protein